MSENITDRVADNANFLESATKIGPVTDARNEEVAGAANILSLESQLSEARSAQLELERAHNTALTNLASWAQGAVSGNGPKLESGGFPLERPRVPIGPLPAPINLRSVAGDVPGTSELSCKAVKGGKSYIAQCALTPVGPWTTIYTGSKARCTATDLTSGTLYYFRMAVIGAAGQSPWSDISEKRAP
ncbi:MAG TPA: fibronectin type III domain-containing protein [Verrucomicrobiae bacterium]|jgi:hypothetical protein